MSFQTASKKIAGKTIKLLVKRGNEEKQITMNVGSRDETNYLISELPQATAQQLKIREVWLKR